MDRRQPNLWVVESSDGRAFETEARSAEDAVAAIAAARRLRPSTLKARARPPRQREWGWPLYVGIFGAFLLAVTLLAILKLASG